MPARYHSVYVSIVKTSVVISLYTTIHVCIPVLFCPLREFTYDNTKYPVFVWFYNKSTKRNERFWKLDSISANKVDYPTKLEITASSLEEMSSGNLDPLTLNWWVKLWACIFFVWDITSKWNPVKLLKVLSSLQYSLFSKQLCHFSIKIH